MERGNNQCPVNMLQVGDLDAVIQKVIQNWGKVLTPKDDIPGVGLFTYMLDIDNNQFGLMQFSATS